MHLAAIQLSERKMTCQVLVILCIVIIVSHNNYGLAENYPKVDSAKSKIKTCFEGERSQKDQNVGQIERELAQKDQQIAQMSNSIKEIKDQLQALQVSTN